MDKTINVTFKDGPSFRTPAPGRLGALTTTLDFGHYDPAPLADLGQQIEKVKGIVTAQVQVALKSVATTEAGILATRLQDRLEEAQKRLVLANQNVHETDASRREVSRGGDEALKVATWTAARMAVSEQMDAQEEVSDLESQLAEADAEVAKLRVQAEEQALMKAQEKAQADHDKAVGELALALFTGLSPLILADAVRSEALRRLRSRLLSKQMKAQIEAQADLPPVPTYEPKLKPYRVGPRPSQVQEPEEVEATS